MKQAHMVTAGAYEDYIVLRVFEDKGDAARFALEYNAARDPFTSAAQVEEIDFVPARGAGSRHSEGVDHRAASDCGPGRARTASTATGAAALTRGVR